MTRMVVTWSEYDDHAYMLPSYNIMGKYYHWSPTDNQYRWTSVRAVLRRDKIGMTVRHARIPDNVPLLHTGDVVDVYMPPQEEINYGELKASVILRLICKADEKECISKNKAEVGKQGTEVISRGKPDMSKLIFSKKFDEVGQKLK